MNLFFNSLLGGRLARLARRIGPEQRAEVVTLSGGQTLNDLAAGLLGALDVDRQIELARRQAGLGAEVEPTAAQDVPFNQQGGLGKAHALFGARLEGILGELNDALAA